MNDKKIFLITAPSGTGKTTVAQKLQKLGLWNECISHTSRPMRDGEIDGVTYYFKDKSEMHDMIENEEFAEYVTYDGHKYGITHKEIERVMTKGKHVFIIVEHDGYRQVKALYPDAVGIFLYMSKEDCLANMLLRGDNLERAMKRISTYDEEMKNRDKYDYVLKNVRGKIHELESMLHAIVRSYN
ncbi:guanylate kinase [Bacillus phage vB_BcoS-136]|uniref:Guanylate kinase n=1 Tax=Bacillus phage vB_BcoS-136 TaxID=2419619 RepID=A0A3G3BVY9_9CAUD|nr:guanylate kinase [Bacillus phage vB_BcoS-136]AYP68310.1 guanylate kinase [Bacillus phage vB_BcoS-136]